MQLPAGWVRGTGGVTKEAAGGTRHRQAVKALKPDDAVLPGTKWNLPRSFCETGPVSTFDRAAAYGCQHSLQNETLGYHNATASQVDGQMAKRAQDEHRTSTRRAHDEHKTSARPRCLQS